MTVHENKTSRRRSPIRDLPQCQTDTSDIEAFEPPAPRPPVDSKLAELLLDASIPRRLRRRLDRGEPICISLTVPGPSWCTPIEQAAQTRWPSSYRVAREGSNRAGHRPDNGNEEIADNLRRGAPVIGISHAASRFQPSALISAANAHLTIKAPNGRQVRKLIKACVFGRAPRNLPDGLASGLEFDEILSAFRANASAGDVIGNLKRASTSKSQVSADDDTPPLDQIAGYVEAKAWGLQLAEGIVAWRRAEVSWRSLSSAAVLHGPPGGGKSLFAKSLAKTLGVPIIVTSPGDWFATTAGNLDSVIKGMQGAWDSARAVAPAVLFIDELDGLPDRRTLSDRGRDWWIPVINYALTMIDGAKSTSGAGSAREGMILLAATNHPNRLDPALVRPGRFDRMIHVPPPDVDGLAGILRHHLGDALPGVDLRLIARQRPGTTGAEAAQWVRDAKAVARAAGRDVTFDDLASQVLPAETRPQSVVLATARHEAAHACVGLALGVQRLESVTLCLPDAEGAARFSTPAGIAMSRTSIEAVCVMALSGRAADELFGEADAGAGGGATSDLGKATRLLAVAHASFGLGKTLLSVDPKEAEARIHVDPALAATIEGDLQRLYARAKAMVREHRGQIEMLAAALIHRRFMTGAEVQSLFTRHSTGPARPMMVGGGIEAP